MTADNWRNQRYRSFLWKAHFHHYELGETEHLILSPEKQKKRGQWHPQRGAAVIREGTWMGKAFGSQERPGSAQRGVPQKALLQESRVNRRGKWIFSLARWRMCSEQCASRNKSSFSSLSSLLRNQSPQSTNDCSELMNMCLWNIQQFFWTMIYPPNSY